MIKNRIALIKENKKTKKVLFIALCVFLFLYTFSLPSFSGRNHYNYISYGIMILLSVVLVIYLLFYSTFIVKPHLILVPLFVLWALIGTLLYSHEYRRWLTLVFLCLSFFIFYYSFYIIDNARLVLKLIVFALFAFSLYFLIIYRKEVVDINTYRTGLRLGFYFDNVNQIASYMNFGIAAALFLLLFFKKKIDFVYLLPTLVFMFIGFSTGSKKFLITLVFTFIVLLFFKLKKHSFVFLICLVTFIGFSFLIINLPFLSTVKHRLFDAIATLFGEGGSSSTIQRYLWQIAAARFGFQNALTGYGVHGFYHVSGVGTYSHANYAEVLCNFGIIGFALFYGCLVELSVLTIMKRNEISKIALLFLVIFVIYSFTMVFYYNKDYYLVLALMFYLVDFTNDENSYYSLIKRRNKKYLLVKI